MMKRCIAFAVLTLMGVAHGAGAPTQTTLFKSTGPDGRVFYGDRPPADGRPVQTLKFTNLPGSPPLPATLAYLEQLRKGGVAQPTAPLGGELVLFTATWCGYCKSAKAHLAAKGAAYKEIDIGSNSGAAAFAQAGGHRSVPLLVKNSHRVQGFSPAAYDAMLGARN